MRPALLFPSPFASPRTRRARGSLLRFRFRGGALCSGHACARPWAPRSLPEAWPGDSSSTTPTLRRSGGGVAGLPRVARRPVIERTTGVTSTTGACAAAALLSWSATDGALAAGATSYESPRLRDVHDRRVVRVAQDPDEEALVEALAVAAENREHTTAHRVRGDGRVIRHEFGDGAPDERECLVAREPLAGAADPIVGAGRGRGCRRRDRWSRRGNA